MSSNDIDKKEGKKPYRKPEIKPKQDMDKLMSSDEFDGVGYI